MVRTLGYCIYCGSRDEPLGEEHVIPFSLNGFMVLKRASCAACGDITKRFENDIAHKTFIAARTRWDFKTRRPKQRPPSFPATLVFANGSRRVVEVAASELPVSLNFPLLPPPAAVEDAPLGEVYGTLEIQVATQVEINRLLARYGAVTLERATHLSPTSFVRLMAKIAHGAVMAKDSLVLDEPFLVPLILGRDEDYGRFVGNVGKQPEPPADSLHTVGVVITGSGHIVALIRLFAGFGGPEYTVVVGKGHEAARDGA